MALCFSGQAQVIQKAWIIKVYIQYSKLRESSVFQGKRKLFKNPECKKYIQYSEKFHGNSVFRASAGYSKLQNNKKYIQYSENFQGKRKLLKNPEW